MAATSSIGETGFAARYAAALYDLAFEQHVLDQTIDDMAALGRLIAENDNLARMLGNRLTDAGKTAPALNEALAAQGVCALVRHFVGVAAANRRLGELPALTTGFAAYVGAKRGEVVAEVTSAHPLSDVQRNQLRARLTESGHGSVKLIEHVDAALLGGLILKIGTKLYDTSLKSRLSRLNFALKGAA